MVSYRRRLEWLEFRGRRTSSRLLFEGLKRCDGSREAGPRDGGEGETCAQPSVIHLAGRPSSDPGLASGRGARRQAGLGAETPKNCA